MARSLETYEEERKLLNVLFSSLKRPNDVRKSWGILQEYGKEIVDCLILMLEEPDYFLEARDLLILFYPLSHNDMRDYMEVSVNKLRKSTKFLQARIVTVEILEAFKRSD
eukprot:Clim_evm11s5 gene=Clim_evmTU11s5